MLCTYGAWNRNIYIPLLPPSVKSGTMETKTIKISTGNYRSICEFAGELQKERGELVSIDRTLSVLLQKKKLSDLAGGWKMSDKEAEEMQESLRGGWKKWKTKFA